MTLTLQYPMSFTGNMQRFTWTKEANAANDTITGVGDVVFFQAFCTDAAGNK